MYRAEWKGLMKPAKIGGAIGLVLGLCISIGNFDSGNILGSLITVVVAPLGAMLMVGIVVGGFVYTWKLTTYWLVGFFPLIRFVLRLFGCWYLGWIPFLAVSMKTFMQMKRNGE